MTITINIHAETIGALHHDLRQLLQGVTGTPVLISAVPQVETSNPVLSSALSSEADKPKATRTKVQPAAQTIAVAETTVDDMVAATNAKAEEQVAEANRRRAIAEREAREAAEARIAFETKAAHTDVDERRNTVTETAGELNTAKLDYEKDVKPLVLKLAEGANGRDRVLAVLDKFGVANAKLVAPEEFGALRNALLAALEG